jgi:prolyl-tRNA synthetase
MATEEKKDVGITAKKEEDMPEWFEQVCLKAELAEFSDVKGCMVIRPNGYAIWENLQEYFNKVIKSHGVRNAAFSLLIPESYFKKEAEHAKGFSPEVAWVTEAGDSKLEERLAVRPTSETLICKSFKKWLRSYRDLPIRVNQWCSVLRWETKQTKLFLRSREFWWQEGHCIYETKEECANETILFLNEYKKLCENILAVPVIAGVKTQKEKFAGAVDTYTVEALMPDGKALQMGTSHFLGQGFMKSFEVQFLGKDEKMHYPFYNSWGFSTRLMGGLIMSHSDNKGLVLPPRIAPNKVVIIPILIGKETEKIVKKAEEIKEHLSEFNPLLDNREEYTPGWKYNEWEMKGIPIRLEIGPKDVEKDQVVLVRRDTGEKDFVKIEDLKKKIPKVLDSMHENLFLKAQKLLKQNTVVAKDFGDLVKGIREKKLVKAKFCNETECEDWIKEKTEGATTRCMPLDDQKIEEGDQCVHCKKPAKCIIYFSKSY